ncbi:sigma-70 family RNA polymerase sigma factor [Amycolatopsis alba]|uniref:Sigma-70 family RNA polymerase sigma factor n=1 Tax=Amycolatopsis alba DSM 44262 TaxID=1125972 RepID=A0A229S6D4_AMYAL|nr:sigma-70 family RNA polymerase sigma factor [Amycolatopsis alba]OXM54476.1 sigma-70 family RNA polymerase sigma factor [Amycolatopsis alba DSM 44262]
MIVSEKRAGLTQFVRRSAPSVDHDNVVGEALLALYMNWHKIRGEKLAWLYRVAQNKAMDAMRDKNFGHTEIDEAGLIPGRSVLVGSWIPPRPGEWMLFIDAIGALPRHLGLTLTFLDKGWRLEDIAEYLGVNCATVRSYISRAKKELTREIYAPDSGNGTREGTDR